jgi:acetolactate synthase regulatory subunit
MTDLFLSQTEVVLLTGRTVRTAQVKALKAMGIEHKVRPDKSVAILRSHIEKVFDGQTQTNPKKQHQPTVNWDAM